MASAAHLVDHQFTPERARAARAKAQPALRIFHAKRALDRAIKQTKGARLHIDGHGVVSIVSDLRARLEQSLAESRSVRARVDALAKSPSRAEYRAARLARYLGPEAAAALAPAKERTSHQPQPTPIEPTNEPRMVEPLWDTAPGAKG